MSRTCRMLLGLAPIAALAANGWAQDVPPVVAAITAEVTKKSSDPDGRPLPVVAHWANSFGRDNFSSDFQVAMLEEGHHVVPTLPMPSPGVEAYDENGREVVAKLAAWKAPFSLRAGQWEQLLLDEKHPVDDPGRWRHLPKEKTPLVITPDGEIDNWISPFSAVEPWYEVGRYYTSSGSFAQLQEWYPDPPLVILLSNNEARRIKTKHKVEERSKRYVDTYGTGTPLTLQCQAMAEGYVERYAALLKGMHDGLASGTWKQNRLFVAYGAFGPSHFGRWGDWPLYSFTTEDRIDPWHLVWDGGSPSYYTHDWDASTDYRLWSPQVEAMNWVFMLDEVHGERPDFWFEISIWDGNWGSAKSGSDRRQKRAHYIEAGQEWSAERYGGYVQYGMWLTTPRAVREFRGHSVPRADFAEEFRALAAAVDRVWESPVLTRFWRHGRLVPNRSRKHPYQTRIPEKWKNVDRWFMLNTSLGPEGEWDLVTEIPVFSLARVIGEQGEREWLVYAHAPVRPHEGVEIEIPGYGKVTVDVTPGGDFYHVKERDHSITAVG